MNYCKIDTCNMNNGDGIRCVIWLSGCSHHCDGCFNFETWDPQYGDKFDKQQYDFILQSLSQDWVSGCTLTGGDPLYPSNRDEVLEMVKKIKTIFPSKTIWIYTGYKYEDIIKDFSMNSIISYIDVLVDGPFQKNNASPLRHWVGSTNQRVIDIPKSLQENEVILYENNE